MGMKRISQVFDPVAMRTERIDTLFQALDRQGRGVIRLEQFALLGNSVEVELTAAEMSRASHKLQGRPPSQPQAAVQPPAAGAAQPHHSQLRSSRQVQGRAKALDTSATLPV